jgi:hypothetical protein
MNANSPPHTAKIYQFPRKTSAMPGSHNREMRLATDHRLRALPTVEFGSGWYHDAAVQAEWVRKS